MTKPYIRVTSVKPLENHRLRVALSNGRKGVFDVSPYLGIGVFKQLKNPAYFAQVRKLSAGVGWPDGQDLSPLKLADEMRALPRPVTRRRAVARKPQPTVALRQQGR